MEKASFEDFLKLNLRVAVIEDAQEIEGKDKLYKLTLNLGNTTKQVVAGLRPYYKKEDLIGKLVIHADLQPKKIAGLISEGMLLAGEKGGKVALLQPDKNLPPGASIY